MSSGSSPMRRRARGCPAMSARSRSGAQAPRRPSPGFPTSGAATSSSIYTRPGRPGTRSRPSCATSASPWAGSPWPGSCASRRARPSTRRCRSTTARASSWASRRRFSASAFLDDVRRHQAVAFVYVGELCRYLLRLPPTPRDRDHRLRVAAGAGLRPDIWTAFRERFGIARIIEMYGATEGNVALHNADGRVGSVGKPHPMLEDTVRLARFDLARGELVRGPDGFCIPCAPSEPGELLGRVGGAMEYDGYTDRAASERKLVHDAFTRGDAWFRTGDLLRQDADGYYYFVDRIGDTFRWKGENVATQEVADVLCGAPGVTEANVYGVEVPGEDGRAGMAALVLAGGARFDGAALHARAERHLPAYARPAFVRLVSEMDVTGTLKQRKLALAAEGYDPARVTDPLFVRDDAARAYVPLTAAVLAETQAGRRRL